MNALSTAVTLSYSVEPVPSAALSVDDASLACASFIRSLCDLLCDRLGRLEGLFKSFSEGSGDVPIGVSGNDEDSRVDSDNAQAPEPLCHGLMLALRYCLKELYSSNLLGGTSPKTTTNPRISVIVSTVWRPLVNRVLALSLNALRVAMLVVAEAPCDVQFAPAPTAKMRGEYTLLGGVPSDDTDQIGIKVGRK